MGTVVKYYKNSGAECPPDEADYGEICEYDEKGQLLRSTLFEVKKQAKEEQPEA